MIIHRRGGAPTFEDIGGSIGSIGSNKSIDIDYSSPTVDPIAPLITVRFLNHVDLFVGIDGMNHGPFEMDEVASLPEIHARNFDAKGSAHIIKERSTPEPKKVRLVDEVAKPASTPSDLSIILIEGDSYENSIVN
jgi:hypothetical protein